MTAIADAQPVSADELPQRDFKRPGLSKDAVLVSDLLKLLLKIRSRETGVAPKLIARSDELEALAAGVRDGLNILSGWRFEQFGRDASSVEAAWLRITDGSCPLRPPRIDRPTLADRISLSGVDCQLLHLCSTLPHQRR